MIVPNKVQLTPISLIVNYYLEQEADTIFGGEMKEDENYFAGCDRNDVAILIRILLIMFNLLGSPTLAPQIFWRCNAINKNP